MLANNAREADSRIAMTDMAVTSISRIIRELRDMLA